MAAPPAALVAGVVVLPCERRDERRLYDTHRCVSGILVGHNGSYCIVLVPSSSIKDPNRERGDERRLPSPQSSREVQASVALSLCATTHPFHTKFTEGFSIRFSVSETTMRPNPNRVGPNGGPSAGHRSGLSACGLSFRLGPGTSRGAATVPRAAPGQQNVGPRRTQASGRHAQKRSGMLKNAQRHSKTLRDAQERSETRRNTQIRGGGHRPRDSGTCAGPCVAGE
jgi:hypothetical protein